MFSDYLYNTSQRILITQKVTSNLLTRKKKKKKNDMFSYKHCVVKLRPIHYIILGAVIMNVRNNKMSFEGSLYFN